MARLHHYYQLPDGLTMLRLGELLLAKARGAIGLFVARDRLRAEQASQALRFFWPEIQQITFPAWDCLPYDRVSPHPEITSERLMGLARLGEFGEQSPQTILITTANGFVQKLPTPSFLREYRRVLAVGAACDFGELGQFLAVNGYRRTSTVREAGEYAVRGSLIDLFPPGASQAVRIDFFGDTIEKMRSFDPMSQISSHDLTRIDLLPMAEFTLSPAAIATFRQSYRHNFGNQLTDVDPLFRAVSEGRRHPGMEHWLPFFHQDPLVGLMDHCPPDSLILLEEGADLAMQDRLAVVEDHYRTRQQTLADLKPSRKVGHDDPLDIYQPIPSSNLYFHYEDMMDGLALSGLTWRASSQTADPSLWQEGDQNGHSLPLPKAVSHPFSGANAAQRWQALRQTILEFKGKTLLACHSHGGREKMRLWLEEQETPLPTRFVDSWAEVTAKGGEEASLKSGMIGLAVFGLDQACMTRTLLLLTEEEFLGQKLQRVSPAKRRKNSEFLFEITALLEGDIVVHHDHGFGRFAGLEKIDVLGAPHDCLKLLYAGGDRLFLPVENLELLTRYGAAEAEVELDRLGAAQWQARKAKNKERIKDMAHELMRLAAERSLQAGPVAERPEGLWDQFCAGFGFSETDDQLQAIDDVITDLASGRVMDRLICGDVGFGKTEVAMRAAFLAAMTGLQVAILAPTTLLVRQHYRLFSQRLTEFPLRIAQLSRFVASKQQAEIKQAAAQGQVDILIGTHGLLSSKMKFQNLGLVIIDEEQHFGVRQKERLKNLQTNVHLLAMTATPIPRTLQMALNGVRDLSIIATPPVDRLAVHSFVLSYDRLVLAEAIRRERYRNGQIFYVVPQISDLDEVHKRVREHLAPDARIGVAHGQMNTPELERVMEEFIQGHYDILLSTNIVESGLDIPNANTMIIHRADRFGLSQLYQLRGRVGRGRQRAWCYLTYESRPPLRDTALRRLQVMQRLDNLGAGFTLASHDLDIRGAGNLLGEEQSGHMREIGAELYQKMLEEAVEAVQQGGNVSEAKDSSWSPVIVLGIAVMLPEDYVADLPVRMGLYRRLAHLTSAKEVDEFGIEMADRFGKLPPGGRNLLDVTKIKLACKQAGVAKLEIGPKGAVIQFRHDRFAKPAKLAEFIQKLTPAAKLRPDHKLVISRDWSDDERRIAAATKLAQSLAKMAS